MKIPKIEQLQHGRSIFTRFPVDLPKLQKIVTTERIKKLTFGGKRKRVTKRKLKKHKQLGSLRAPQRKEKKKKVINERGYSFNAGDFRFSVVS